MQRPSTIETPRLILRRLTIDDLERLVDLDSDPEVMRYITGGIPTSRERLRDVNLPRMLAYPERDPRLGYYAATEKEGGAFVGWFGFRPSPDDPHQFSLGYRLKRSAWGRGYATEGARALVDLAFVEMGLDLVVADADPENAGSIHVMEKLGMRYLSPIVYDDGFVGAKYGVERSAWQGSSKA